MPPFSPTIVALNTKYWSLLSLNMEVLISSLLSAANQEGPWLTAWTQDAASPTKMILKLYWLIDLLNFYPFFPEAFTVPLRVPYHKTKQNPRKNTFWGKGVRTKRLNRPQSSIMSEPTGRAFLGSECPSCGAAVKNDSFLITTSLASAADGAEKALPTWF